MLCDGKGMLERGVYGLQINAIKYDILFFCKQCLSGGKHLHMFNYWGE